MIVDIHTHAFPNNNVFSAQFQAEATRARAEAFDLVTRYEDYRATAAGCDVAVVFGGKARLSGLWVDDADVVKYVRQDSARLIGFMSLDPTQPNWQEEMRCGYEELGLKGIKLLPMYAGFMPQDSSLDPLWMYAQKHNLPVLLHTGTTFVSQAPLECTLPRHLDDVARRFPDVKIIMAHLGHPYEAECVVVIRKHPNVYADISGLHYRPWQLFHSLMLVHEYGVWPKLLFGTDFPFTTVEESLAGLKNLCTIKIDRFRVPWEKVEEVIHRNTLEMLGLEHPNNSTANT